MTTLQQEILPLEEVDDFKIDYMRSRADKSGEAVDPKKRPEHFRNYTNSARQARVELFYQQQHELQTFEFVKSMHEKYTSGRLGQMSIWEAMEYLDNVIDDSDPDTSLTQMEHAIQTAESIRRKWPEPEMEWLQIVGLIHDLGKLMAVTDKDRKLVGLDQWAVVGDTFPVGCAFQESNIFASHFSVNPDTINPLYNSTLGIYKSRCGFGSMTFSWGHDEYLYRVLKKHEGCALPKHALYVIRFHSFYPWHAEGGYSEFADETDQCMLKWLKEFNQFDLYSKSDEIANTRDELKKYYKNLVERYIPGVLQW